MTSTEIKSFLAANADLFGPGLGEQAVVDVEDVYELFRRLFKSKEYKAFVERERWQQAAKNTVALSMCEVFGVKF